MAEPAKGISLHIGLNRVDPTQYIDRAGNGWEGRLEWCEKDAEDLARLAQAQGFRPTILRTAQATGDSILRHITDAAAAATQGDVVLVTFSGHGGRREDKSGDERDQFDETWVAYDRQVLDDELYGLYDDFAAGVRLIILSDSCFSGGLNRGVPPPSLRPKYLPDDVAEMDETRRGDLYRKLKRAGASDDEAKSGIVARTLILTACDELQWAYVGAHNSVFTDLIRRVWKRGEFQGSYAQLYDAVKDESPSYQTPQRFLYGPPEPDLLAERPFTIA